MNNLLLTFSGREANKICNDDNIKDKKISPLNY